MFIENAYEVKNDEKMLTNFRLALSYRMQLGRYRGRHGWDNESVCSVKNLEQMLRDQLAKPCLDPLDIGAIAGMLFARQAVTWTDEAKRVSTIIERTEDRNAE